MCLLIHGLNFKPARMMAIAELLGSNGVESLIVSLRGHGDNFEPATGAESIEQLRLEALKSTSRSTWLQEAHEAYTVAREFAAENGVPLLLVGFSLGALIGTDMLQDTARNVSFDGMILFAPALRVHWYTHLLRLLAPFPRLVLPSRSPRDYAANPGTPIAAYNALFESLAAVRARGDSKLGIRTLAFIDPSDELVSYRGLQGLGETVAGEQWSLVALKKTLRHDDRDFHHLIIDSRSLGEAIWRDVSRRVRVFLSEVVAKGRRQS